LLALLLLLILFYFRAPVRLYVSEVVRYSPFGCYSTLERASCVAIGTDQEKAVEYISANTDSEPIFVGNVRHDLISINDIGFYFLADRASATRYHELYPGVATTHSVQVSIIDDIKSK